MTKQRLSLAHTTASRSSEFVIERGVPITKRGATKYPFASMEVGDSFLVPCADGDGHKTRNNVSSACVSYSRGQGRSSKYLARIVDGGVRVWRTA